MSKPRVMTSFFKLDKDIQEQIKLNYPKGFEKYLIRFKNHKNKFVSALPYETEDKYYMVKMTLEEANKIILEDEDYNERGVLKTTVKESYEAKYEDDDEDFDDDLELDIDEVEIDQSEVDD